MPFEKYQEKKAADLVTIAVKPWPEKPKEEDLPVYVVETKVYSEATGAALPPRVTSVPMVDLLNARSRIQARLDDLNTLIADLEAIEVPVKPAEGVK